MESGTAVFTIVAKNYLAQARVLMSSVSAHHPGWRRFVILVDRVDGYFDVGKEPFEVVLSGDLPIAHTRWFHFKYSILELSTAVKPYAFAHLFEAYGFERIVYLDPDIRVYAPMKKVTAALERASIVLTPHLTEALADACRPTEIDILRAGAYNLGFVAVARSAESAAFLSWWQQRLYDHCVVDLPRGLFVDQKWMDLAPGMFAGVAILRDPGYNVAYWNLSHRVLRRVAPGYAVGDAPLAFFHFSGYDPDQPEVLSKHQNRHRIEDLPEATRQVLTDYRRELFNAGYRACRKWPFAFAAFDNGVRIPDAARLVDRESQAAVADPFSDVGFDRCLRVWNTPVQSPGEGVRPGITRLAYRIYSIRADVQAAIPDIFGANYRRFLEWMLVSGRVEHGLEDRFLTPVLEAIRGSEGEPEAWVDAADPDAFSEAAGTGGLRLTRLVEAIYQSRPELQRRFPDPRGRDAARFLVWLLSYGRREHRLSAQHVAPMALQWGPLVGRGWRYGAELRCREAAIAVREVVTGRPVLRAELWLRARWQLRRSRMVDPVR